MHLFNLFTISIGVLAQTSMNVTGIAGSVHRLSVLQDQISGAEEVPITQRAGIDWSVLVN